jgi:26S proteasome regulatory subunit N2
MGKFAKILGRLLVGTLDDADLGYQICFDLVDHYSHNFLSEVREQIQNLIESPHSNAVHEHKRYSHALGILSGVSTLEKYIQFLDSYTSNALAILTDIQTVVDNKKSAFHSAILLANAYMHCGTTVDTFMRKNLEMLSQAAKWVKFSATVSLGAINRGNVSLSRQLMSPYMSCEGRKAECFAEGGALFALGLIHSGQSQDIEHFLLKSLKGTTNEIVQHGACLGLGVAALASNNKTIVEDINTVLFNDNAVAGEAAGIAMGLLQAGSGSEKAQEVLNYARDTQHEKIMRGLVLGLALMMFGRGKKADQLVTSMICDEDPIIRSGGMLVIGLAYSGTSNYSSIRRLLHYGVSDISDDVRRAAIMMLGFVLKNFPERCNATVKLLIDSYNPHIRYGVAMAIGISCCSNGNEEALKFLKKLQVDTVDFVRQGALIATSLVLMAQPGTFMETARKHLETTINDQNEELLTKVGAIISSGILNGGGRNSTVRLECNTIPKLRMMTVLGLTVFTQYWYWYNLSYFLSISIQPCTLIGLSGGLKESKFLLNCNCKPSSFAYTSFKNVESSISSITSSSTTVEVRQSRNSTYLVKPKEAINYGQVSDEQASKGGSFRLAEAPPEPRIYRIENMCRVMPLQNQYLTLPLGSRWSPIVPGRCLAPGILILKDRGVKESF